MPASTSLLGPNVAVLGTLFQIDNGLSPDTFETVTNISEISIPTIQKTIDVTNIGDLWVRTVPVLKDMGKITLKLFWQMADTSQNNSSPFGLRYCLVSFPSPIRIFKVLYPDTAASQDVFPAYVTGFMVTGSVGKAYEASIDLANSGAPTLC
jgi:hypothetical protein